MVTTRVIRSQHGAIPMGYGLYAPTGLTRDGTGDNTATLLAAWQVVHDMGGGELRLPVGTIRCDGQLLAPNNGTAVPSQKPITIRGAGCHKDTTTGSGAPSGGTILDLRYTGAGVSKIDTRGRGYLALRDLSITDKSATPNTMPFIQTTNTALDIDESVAFYGNPTRAGTACDQDAIVLGGLTETIDGANTAPFQGYGTRIHGTFFDRIRRAVYLRTYANGVQVTDLCVWNKCGSNLAGGAAIELLGLSNSTCTGNYIVGNLIEMVNYAYAVKAAYAVNNTFGPNNLFDMTATTLAAYRFEAGANYNLVTDGYRTDTKQLISEAAGVGNTNTAITSHQSQVSTYSQPARFVGGLEVVGLGFGPLGFTPTGDSAYLRVTLGINPYPLVSIAARAAVQVTDGVTTSGSPTVTSAGAVFVAGDLGRPLAGAGIPANSYIARINSVTSVDLTQNATVTATVVTLSIGRTTGTETVGPSFSRHHILATGSAPSGAVGAGAGTGATFSIAGKDLAGMFTVTTGAVPVNGAPGTPTLLGYYVPAINYTAQTRLALTPKNVGAAQLVAAGLYATTSGVGRVDIYCIGAVPVLTACEFDFHAMQ